MQTAVADNTAPKPRRGQHLVQHQFKAGAPSANPAGRPKGSRNKLGEALVQKLYEDFQTHGEDAIIACREEDPATYLKIVAQIIPKEVVVREGTALSTLTDDQLLDALENLRAERAKLIDAVDTGAG